MCRLVISVGVLSLTIGQLPGVAFGNHVGGHFGPFTPTTRGVVGDDLPTVAYNSTTGELAFVDWAPFQGSYHKFAIHLTLGPEAPFRFFKSAADWAPRQNSPFVQASHDAFCDGFVAGRLLPPGLREAELLRNIESQWTPGGDNFRLATSVPGDLVIVENFSSLPEPHPCPLPPPPLPETDPPTFLYNDRTGQISIEGPEAVAYSTITPEIKTAADGTPAPADFSFNIEAPAIWDDQDLFQKRDEKKLQGFITVPGLFGDFVMRSGDEMGALLAPNQADLFLNHVEIRFYQVGSTSSGPAVMKVIPEPSSIGLALMALSTLLISSGRMRCDKSCAAALLFR